MNNAVVVTLLLSMGASVSFAEEGYPVAKLLIEPGDLASRLPGLVILDARPRREYEAGHIPGAIVVDEDGWKKLFPKTRDPSDWGRRIGALGIDGKTPIVIYDDAGGNHAARAWWILRYFGVPDARLLNGFWRGWKEGKFPTETREPSVAPTRFDARPAPERLSTKEDLLAAFKSGKLSMDIVDARSEGEYCGRDPQTNKRAGHMPGSKNLDWTMLVDLKGSHRFKSPAELRALFADAGIDLKRPIVTHCQSGGRSSVMAFALELMGASQVANYYNSWSEWGNSSDTPIDDSK